MPVLEGATLRFLDAGVPVVKQLVVVCVLWGVVVVVGGGGFDQHACVGFGFGFGFIAV